MNLSFFDYIKKFVDHDANDTMSRLANKISSDNSFPKQAETFEEITNYLEHSSEYGKLVTIFDTAWQKYQFEK